jgi:hypothetical protein
MTTAMSTRQRPRGYSPLSQRTRRRLLADLCRRALAGDAQAAESLIRLSGQPTRPAPALLALAPSAGPGR